MADLPSSLTTWLDAQADALDDGQLDADLVLPRLADAGMLGIGVDPAQGGAGGRVGDAVDALARVAEHSLTAAFVLWGQRTFIAYLGHTDNPALRARLLPSLLRGELAGATGLSNAIKFLSRLEELQVRGEPAGDGEVRLHGRLPWVTNLRKRGFVAAFAVDHGGVAAPSIYAVPSDAAGLARSADLELLAMQASNTAALSFDGVQLSDAHRLHADARAFLRAVRPEFLALQCGLAVGLTRRALRETEACGGESRAVLQDETAALARENAARFDALIAGTESGAFLHEPARLFALRIRLAELSAAAVSLEVQARGGRGYLRAHCAGLARRRREAAFVPIVTPSLVQLRAELRSAT
ncbi:MAG: acyl-CoA dehydrogenase family protein [Polyangiales bacterium]